MADHCMLTSSKSGLFLREIVDLIICTESELSQTHNFSILSPSKPPPNRIDVCYSLLIWYLLMEMTLRRFKDVSD